MLLVWIPIGICRRCDVIPTDTLPADWPAPACVRAFTTLRPGGVSNGHWGAAGGGAGMNLGSRCGDIPQHVRANRARLRKFLPAEPLWLEQVHGVAVVDADAPLRLGSDGEPVADAAFTTCPGRVLSVLTADCLPVFLSDDRGEIVGLAHAGWRGLASGVLEATLVAMRQARGGARGWLAHLGPAIGPTAFEVGEEVLQTFIGWDPRAASAFVPSAQPGRWWADLFALATRRLTAAGVDHISGGRDCTVSDPVRFYSHRRDRRTGRMASLIWIN
jgi:YfiH family protein